MVDFIHEIEAVLGGVLTNSRRGKTPTEKHLSKLEGSNKLDSEMLQYPSGLGETKDGKGHYIKFQVWETAGLSDSDGRGNTRAVNGIDEIDGQPVRNNASKTTRRTAALGNIPMIPRESIHLYMPEEIKTAYNAEWDLGEVGVGTGRALNTLREAGGSGADLLDVLQTNANAAADILGANFNKESIKDSLLSLQQAISQSSSLRNTISAATRTVRNPHLDFLFKTVGTRQFNFDFRFNPYDEKEAEATYKIIKAFKTHMHPALKTLNGDDANRSALGVFYQYPSVFKISFHSHGVENTWMHKMAVSALVGMEVDYAAAGTSSFHRNKPDSGSPPTDIIITLSFIELDILSRENIEEGF